MPNVRPLIIAHRGASAEAPENTMAAFKLGLQQGAGALELDIHLSRDGGIIVCHDETVNRTTNGSGRIAYMTVSELKRLDAGQWFNDKYAGERLPLLEEVFDLFPSDMPINVEIKAYTNPAVYRALIELMKKKNRMDTVIVSSFGHECLLVLKRLEPTVKIGLLYHTQPIHYRAWSEQHAVKLFSIHPHHSFITPEYVTAARDYGLHVYPWTVDLEARMREVAAAGVSGIITNVPGKLKQLLEEGH